MANATQAQIDHRILVYNQAEAAAAWFGELVVEMQQVSGDDYMMVWTDETRGDWPPAQ